MFYAKFCLPQIPQIFADVDCMLKLKLKVDSRRYFCFQTSGSKNPFVTLKKIFVHFVFRCVLRVPPFAALRETLASSKDEESVTDERNATQGCCIEELTAGQQKRIKI
jgi:hypothetical protein